MSVREIKIFDTNRSDRADYGSYMVITSGTIYRKYIRKTYRFFRNAQYSPQAARNVVNTLIFWPMEGAEWIDPIDS